MGTASVITRSDTLPDEQVFEIRRTARLEAARRAAKRKDILRWGEALFPEKFSLPFCHKLHSYFVKIRGERFTNTEAPRNHAKTTGKCFLVPLFQGLEEPETFNHYLNVQATATKAVEVNRSIKLELESNELLLALYGDKIGERWTDQQFCLKDGPIYTAIGAGQSVRGMNVRNKRPDYLIVDDLYDEEDIYNPESTEKKNRWFWGSLYPARAKSRRCSIHVQGTAINPYDLLEQLKTRPGVKSASFRAIEDEAKGLVLWPELNSIESLKEDRILMGPLIFAREMQNERLDDTTTILKRSHWKFYTVLPSGFDIQITSWDMTFKETKSGSYVVGQVWGRRGADYYLFPVMVRGRMDFVEACEAFKNLARQYPQATGHLIEEKANGSAVMSMLHRVVPGIVPILPHGSKIARAVAITPVLAAGNIHIPDPSIAPWVTEYIEEAARFRGSDSEINDQVDTTTQAVNYLNQTRYTDPEDEEEGDFVEDAEQAGEFTISPHLIS